MLDPFAEDVAEQLARCMETDGSLGVRLGAACPYDGMWERFDPSVTSLRDAIDETEFWTTARETDATVQILCAHVQLDQAREFVETFPELTSPFDHFAHAGPDTPTDEGTFSRGEQLADDDGVAVKISEIAHMSESSFQYADMHDHVRWLVDTFGRERVIWGPDYPTVSGLASYAEATDWLREVEGLSAADREWLTGTSFRRHVGLD